MSAQISKNEAKIIINETLRLTTKDIKICDDCSNNSPRNITKEVIWCSVVEEYQPNYRCTCDFYDKDYDSKYDRCLKVGIISPEGEIYFCEYSEHNYLTDKIIRHKNIKINKPCGKYDFLKELGYVYVRYNREEGYWLDGNDEEINPIIEKLFYENFKVN